MIKAEKLTFTYPGQKTATIKSIDFSITKGEIYGFLGPSGAGKSTTQKILIRLLSGFSGNVEVLNKPLQQWKNNYYNHIGVGFELPNHYTKLSGLENLQLFASLYQKKTQNPMELLDMVGLKDAASQKTQDYSKGMKMRLNFVRALLHNPDILFFDEPTSGLDPVNARKLKNIILDLKARGKTIFITTHNMHDADELCDRVAFISDGEIKAEDEPKKLKLKYGKPMLKVEYLNDGVKQQEFPLENLGEHAGFSSLIKDYPIVSMHSEEASLDEVFIKITGKHLH